jgi:hypothetical protein
VKDSVKSAKESILSFLTNGKNPFPLSLVIDSLSDVYDADLLEKAIQELLKEFTIDQVLDYAPKGSGLDTGRPVWFLKALSPDEQQELRSLSSMEIKLLKILRNSETESCLGMLPVEEAVSILVSEGYEEDDARWVFIEGRVDHFYTSVDGGSVECLGLIPEYEKTEEYRLWQEEMDRKHAEKERFWMRVNEVHDLASDILEAVRASPKGISRSDIIKALPESPPDYYTDAFEIAADENEILPIELPNGEQGYRLNPDFENEEP